MLYGAARAQSPRDPLVRRQKVLESVKTNVLSPEGMESVQRFDEGRIELGVLEVYRVWWLTVHCLLNDLLTAESCAGEARCSPVPNTTSENARNR